MGFLDYLVETYGYNEAIASTEISYKSYSRPWIAKEIRKLCGEGKLKRFEKGIYYVPTETLLGPSKLDPRKVITKKYINDGTGVIGYYSGVTFMNMLGLSTQMPNTLEIYTNNEQSTVREVPVGSQKVILRRARASIDESNVSTMSFLELMNFTDATFYDDERRKIVADYISAKGITRKAVAEYSPYFPDKALRTLVESGVIYDVTQ